MTDGVSHNIYRIYMCNTFLIMNYTQDLRINHEGHTLHTLHTYTEYTINHIPHMQLLGTVQLESRHKILRHLLWGGSGIAPRAVEHRGATYYYTRREFL